MNTPKVSGNSSMNGARRTLVIMSLTTLIAVGASHALESAHRAMLDFSSLANEIRVLLQTLQNPKVLQGVIWSISVGSVVLFSSVVLFVEATTGVVRRCRAIYEIGWRDQIHA